MERKAGYILGNKNFNTFKREQNNYNNVYYTHTWKRKKNFHILNHYYYYLFVYYQIENNNNNKLQKVTNNI